MTRLSKRISVNARRGRSVPAVVIDVFFDKATVKLGENGRGAIQRGLKFVGGPPSVGEIVDIDYTTPVPTLVMRGKEWLTADDLATALSDFDSGVSNEFSFPIILFSGGAMADIYPASSEGLTAALADANSGDVISIQDIDAEGSFTVSDGISITGISSRQSIIRGDITLGSGCVLEQLSVLCGKFLGGEVVAINVPATTETSFIRNCEVHGYNCNGGNAVAIDVASGAELIVEKSTVISDSATGQAWGVRGVSGADCRITQSFVYGKTDQYTGTGISVYSNVPFQSEIARGCAIPVDEFRSFYVYGNNDVQIGSQFANLDPSALAPGPITPIMFHQDTYTATSRVCILRQGTYLYTPNNVGGNLSIKEYDMGNGADQTVVFKSGVNPTTYSWNFCLVGDQTLIAYDPVNESNNREIYQISFLGGTPTVTTIHTFDKSPEPTIENNAYANAPSGCVAVQTLNDEVVVILFGVYYEYGTNQYNGVYTIAKNITQDSGWVETFKLFDNDWYNTNTPYFYSAPAFVRNEKMVLPISQGSHASSSDPTTKRSYIMVFDIETMTFQYIKRSTTNLSQGRDSNFYYCVAANDEGLAFTVSSYGVETNEDAIYKIDPYAVDMDDGYLQLTWGAVMLLQSPFEAYAYDHGPEDLYVLGGLGETQLWTGWTGKPADGFFPYDGCCPVIDSNERIWYYDDSTGNRLIGMKVTDNEDTISFDCGVTYPTAVSPRMMTIALLGDRFVLCQRKYATDDVRYYLIKGSE